MTIRIVIELNTDNDAFNDDVYGAGAKCYEILQVLSAYVDHMAHSAPQSKVLYDSNGNRTGKAVVTRGGER